MLVHLLLLISRLINQSGLRISQSQVFSSELGTLECDILNPDILINLEINNKRRTSVI